MSLYEPLDPSRKEIRSLILESLTSGEDIQCTTTTISLLSPPIYEALSYVWGDANIRETITFNGIPTEVTKNLHTALAYLRLPNKPRHLWVDALCINQQDIEERNSQVAMMGEVYASAKPVLIWLGEADEDSDEAFTLMSKVSSDKDIAEDISQKLFSFYMQLIEREWFTRLWTIQELVLASHDPLVGCGHIWTTWSTLLGAWQKIALIEFTKMGMVIFPDNVNAQGNDSSLPKTTGVRPSGIRIDLLNNLRSSVLESKGSSLRDLILNTNSANATEPRDRIYGLLGMLDPSARQEITVDYGRPIGTIFAEAVSHVFRHGKGAFLLSGMQLMGPSSNTTYPSWVPIFGDKALLKPTRFHPPSIGASGAGSDAVNGSIDEDLTTLRIRGMPIDTVVEKLRFGEGQACLNQLPQVEALANKARERAATYASDNPEIRPYLRSFKTKEPLWRILIANKAYSGAARYEAPESYGEMYDRLLDFCSGGRSPPGTVDEDSEISDVREYRLCLLNMLPGKCFFVTQTGFCGIGPDCTEEGDLLAVWFGAPAPFVLRPIQETRNENTAGEENGERKSEKVYNVCGVAYVAGIMDGELVDEVYCEDLEDDMMFVVR
ncbi:heterokaryon incompatibility protein-domain-containing protein [Cadophora sp. MPI-SDFR-AT-0126]|nr:heterokaryon incompatibility protein-domain-containing protein [Leotiomycetes sp. MPI-SDFR-AT-0126]